MLLILLWNIDKDVSVFDRYDVDDRIQENDQKEYLTMEENHVFIINKYH
jgi:hypothetical protein